MGGIALAASTSKIYDPYRLVAIQEEAMLGQLGRGAPKERQPKIIAVKVPRDLGRMRRLTIPSGFVGDNLDGRAFMGLFQAEMMMKSGRMAHWVV